MSKQCPDCWNHSLYLQIDETLGKIIRCVTCKYTITETTYKESINATTRFEILESTIRESIRKENVARFLSEITTK